MALEPSIDPAVALQQWLLPEPWSIELASAGFNNTSLFVGTPVGRYVLRLYDQGDPASVRYEHGVLAALTAALAEVGLAVSVARAGSGVSGVERSAVGPKNCGGMGAGSGAWP